MADRDEATPTEQDAIQQEADPRDAAVQDAAEQDADLQDLERAKADRDTRWSEVGVPLLAVASITALLLGTLLGWLVFGSHDPGDDSADAGFARDMSEHHAQAVDMAILALERTDDPRVRTLAYDIATSQENQIGQMQAWLIAWGLPSARPGDRMTWMAGHDHAAITGPSVAEGGPAMPGMATRAELQQLTDADGEAADILFLQLMTTHHLAGVEMAEAGVAQGSDSEVLRLAHAMVNSQASEVQLMVDLLADKGAAPRESAADIAAVIGGGSGEAPTETHDMEGMTH